MIEDIVYLFSGEVTGIKYQIFANKTIERFQTEWQGLFDKVATVFLCGDPDDDVRILFAGIFLSKFLRFSMLTTDPTRMDVVRRIYDKILKEKCERPALLGRYMSEICCRVGVQDIVGGEYTIGGRAFMACVTDLDMPVIPHFLIVQRFMQRCVVSHDRKLHDVFHYMLGRHKTQIQAYILANIARIFSRDDVVSEELNVLIKGAHAMILFTNDPLDFCEIVTCALHSLNNIRDYGNDGSIQDLCLLECVQTIGDSLLERTRKPSPTGPHADFLPGHAPEHGRPVFTLDKIKIVVSRISRTVEKSADKDILSACISVLTRLEHVIPGEIMFDITMTLLEKVGMYIIEYHDLDCLIAERGLVEIDFVDQVDSLIEYVTFESISDHANVIVEHISNGRGEMPLRSMRIVVGFLALCNRPTTKRLVASDRRKSHIVDTLLETIIRIPASRTPTSVTESVVLWLVLCSCYTAVIVHEEISPRSCHHISKIVETMCAMFADESPRPTFTRLCFRMIDSVFYQFRDEGMAKFVFGKGMEHEYPDLLALCFNMVPRRIVALHAGKIWETVCSAIMGDTWCISIDRVVRDVALPVLCEASHVDYKSVYPKVVREIKMLATSEVRPLWAVELANHLGIEEIDSYYT
jgi:hypothetical protein